MPIETTIVTNGTTEALEKNKFEKFLEENKNAISSNVKVKYPFRINWLVSDVCNLDCIYCCANNKMNPAKLDGELLKKTAKHMLTLSPLTVGLTGGEPTLCLEIGSIIEIGRYLRKYKIEKWQLYPVNYSERCKDFLMK